MLLGFLCVTLLALVSQEGKYATFHMVGQRPISRLKRVNALRQARWLPCGGGGGGVLPMMAYMGRPLLIGQPFLSFSAFVVIFFKPMCNKTVIRFGFCSILRAVIRVGKNGDEKFPEQTREPLGLLLSLVTGHGNSYLSLRAAPSCSFETTWNSITILQNPVFLSIFKNSLW